MTQNLLNLDTFISNQADSNMFSSNRNSFSMDKSDNNFMGVLDNATKNYQQDNVVAEKCDTKRNENNGYHNQKEKSESESKTSVDEVSDKNESLKNENVKTEDRISDNNETLKKEDVKTENKVEIKAESKEAETKDKNSLKEKFEDSDNSKEILLGVVSMISEVDNVSIDKELGEFYQSNILLSSEDVVQNTVDVSLDLNTDEIAMEILDTEDVLNNAVGDAMLSATNNVEILVEADTKNIVSELDNLASLASDNLEFNKDAIKLTKEMKLEAVSAEDTDELTKMALELMEDKTNIVQDDVKVLNKAETTLKFADNKTLATVNQENQNFSNNASDMNIKANTENTVEVKSDKLAKLKDSLEKAEIKMEALEEMGVKISSTENGATSNNSFLNQQSAQEAGIKLAMHNSGDTKISHETLKIDNQFTQAMNSASETQPKMSINEQKMDIISQIQSKLKMSVSSANSKMNIVMTPESLGKVTVEILSNKNGLTAKFVAETPQVREVLEKNLDGLKTTLSNQGVNVSNISVKLAGETTANNSDGDNFNRQGENEFKEGQENSRNSKNSNRDNEPDFDKINEQFMKMANGSKEEFEEITI